MKGFVTVERRILAEGWYKDIPCKTLYMHILLCCAYSNYEFAGRELGPGQYFTSIRRLADETGLSVKEVRGALERLSRAHEIRNEGHRGGTLITLEKTRFYDIIRTSEGTPKGTDEGKYNNKNKYKNKYYNKEPRKTNLELWKGKERTYDNKSLEKMLFEKYNKQNLCVSQNNAKIYTICE